MTATPLSFHFATDADVPLLAEWNRLLIRDEGHRNPMTIAELAARMRGWLEGEYRAVLLSRSGVRVAYALYREQPDEIYVRQLFVLREHRRQGVGRKAIHLLQSQVWPAGKRLTVDVLVHNTSGAAFWRAVGFEDYSITLEALPSHKSPDSPQASDVHDGCT